MMSKKRFFAGLVIAISFLLPGCSPIQGPSTAIPVNTLASTPKDGKYRPPQGVYACDFSAGQGIQSRVNEYYSASSFETVQSDDFGYWMSVLFRRIDDQYLPVPEDPEARKQALSSALSGYMEHRIKPEVPEGKIIEQEYLEKDSLILLAILDLPGGSNML